MRTVTTPSIDESAPPQRRRLQIYVLAVMVIASVALDQVTKLAAEKYLMVWSDSTDLGSYQGRRLPIWSLGDMLEEQSKFHLSANLNYVRNMGAAWGSLSQLPDGVRGPFFFVVTIIAVVVIAFYFRSTPANNRFARFGLALILSGAIGNFLNRLMRGYVIDWIDVHWNFLGWRYFFPNFNWADICITVGVALLMFDTMILERKRRAIERPRGLSAVMLKSGRD